MSQEYSCVDLLQVSEAEQKEGMEQLKAAAKKYVAYKALNAAWQFDIGGVGGRTMTDRIDNFVLCKRVVVEHPAMEHSAMEHSAMEHSAMEHSDTEPAVEYPIQVAEFLEEGDRICRIKKVIDDATNQYPF
jgi:hypothetical protein